MSIFDSILNFSNTILKDGKQAVTGAFDVTKNFITPDRGFDLMSPMDLIKGKMATQNDPVLRAKLDTQYKSQQPTFKENLLTVPKIASEMISGVGNLAGSALGNNPLFTKDSLLGKLGVPGAGKTLEDISRTKVGGTLANAGGRIEEFAVPKTAGQAQAMRIGDVLSVFPMGSVKSVASASKIIAASKDVNIITGELKKLGILPDVVKDLAPKMAIINDEKFINELLTHRLKPERVPAKTAIAKNIHPEDRALMLKYIDNVRLKKHLTGPDLSKADLKGLSFLAEKWKINTDRTPISMADVFEKIVEGRKKVVGTAIPGSIAKPRQNTQGGFINFGKIFEDITGVGKKKEVSQLKSPDIVAQSPVVKSDVSLEARQIVPERILENKIASKPIRLDPFSQNSVPPPSTLKGTQLQSQTKSKELIPSLDYNVNLIKRPSLVNTVAPNTPLRNLDTVDNLTANPKAFKKAEGKISESWVKLRETVQDNWIRVKNIQRQKGVVVKEGANPYQAETLFHGRVASRLNVVKDTIKEVDKDIVSLSKSLNIPDKQITKEVNDYLHATHAPERNLRFGDGASGITNAEAKTILDGINSSPRAKEIKDFALKLSDVNKSVLTVLKDSQVIDQATFDTLTKTYKNHVPLQRVMEGQDIVGSLTGRGFNVKGSGIIRAKGSEREVADIITNITASAEQAIIRAEKNLVDLNTLNFARNNKNLGLFEEINARVIGKDFDGKILKEQINDPQILSLRENGKPVYLKINDPHIAAALKGVNVEHMPSVLKWVSEFTRLYSGLHTRFNYEFALSNKVRDIQEMVVYMASQKGVGFKGASSVVTREPKSIKAVLDSMRGIDSEGGRLYNQMKLDGGTTGGIGLSTRKQVEVDIDKLRKLNRSNPRQAAQKVIETVDNWNTIFEDSTRLSVYKEALGRGLSRNEAAVLAKESTINFNKKGTGGSIINGLYMFSNASIQGSTKMLRAMKDPKVAATVISSVGLGVYGVNSWNDKVDPDWRDKISKWDRSSNITIMLPSDGKANYITIPVSWGLKPIKVAMEHSYDLITGKGDSIGSAFKGIATAAIEAYNPLAGNDSIVKTLTPTFLKTPMEIYSNKSWSGGMIEPNFNNNKPDSQNYFSSLTKSFSGRSSIKVSNVLSNIGIEISPANFNYAFEQYIGGVGRAFSRVINTSSSLIKGEELETKELPVINRFYKTETDRSTTNPKTIAQETLALMKTGVDEKTAEASFEGKMKEYKTGEKKRRMDMEPRKYATALLEAMKNKSMTEGEAEREFMEYERSIKVKEKRKTEMEKEVPKRGPLQLLEDYGKAYATDPMNAARGTFTSEKLKKVEGNAVVFGRMGGVNYLDKGGSEEVMSRKLKEMGIPASKRDRYNLEHIVPLITGGNNSESNLVVVSRSLHDSYTNWDILAGKAVTSGMMTRGEVTDIARKLKVSRSITIDEAISLLK